MVPIRLVQRDIRSYDAPDECGPGRPLDGPHLPFGGGGRSCIAEPLVRAELAAVLAVLADRLPVEPIWGDEWMERPSVPQRSGLERPLIRR